MFASSQRTPVIVADRMRALVLAATITLASTMFATPARAAEQRGESDLCCILCGGWAALLVLTCPPCTFCAQPLFSVVGATSGECFKGSGDLALEDLADGCVTLAAPAPKAHDDAPKEEEPEDRDDDSGDNVDQGTIYVMRY